MDLRFLTALICYFFAIRLAASLTTNKLQIIGGRNTTIAKHPYQVAVSLNGRFWCSGVVISCQWVLTTASCVSGYYHDPDLITVRAKSDRHNAGGVRYSCTAAVLNGNFNKPDYDVAVLKIKGRFQFGKHLKPIKLGSKRLQVGKSAVISGWGASSKDSKISKTLRELDVAVLSKEDCSKTYPRVNITNRMFCAGSEDYGPSWNDNADPLVANGRLYGLLSFNNICFGTYFPSVYSDIPSMKDWIHATISNK